MGERRKERWSGRRERERERGRGRGGGGDKRHLFIGANMPRTSIPYSCTLSIHCEKTAPSRKILFRKSRLNGLDWLMRCSCGAKQTRLQSRSAGLLRLAWLAKRPYVVDQLVEIALACLSASNSV